MSADHFRKRADLLTAVVCFFGYCLMGFGCAVAINSPTISADAITMLAGMGSAATILFGYYLLRVVRLTRELEQENLDEIYQRPDWDQVKADLAKLHNLHGKN